MEPKDKKKAETHDPKYWCLARLSRFTQIGNPPTLRNQMGIFIVARDPDKQKMKMLQKTFPWCAVIELKASEINKHVIP